jgi:hypothetical protein
MGSMPRLPKKIFYRYRKGSTDESENCKHCVNITMIPESFTPRCWIMGLKPSIRYRIREDHRCDVQVLDRASCWWLKEHKS